jgi:hypothetical protein
VLVLGSLVKLVERHCTELFYYKNYLAGPQVSRKKIWYGFLLEKLQKLQRNGDTIKYSTSYGMRNQPQGWGEGSMVGRFVIA